MDDSSIVIAIFLVLFTAPFWVILLKRRIARWWDRHLEEKSFVQFRLAPSTKPPDRRLRAAFFPLATASWPVLLLVAFVFAAVRGPEKFATGEWRAVLWAINALAVLFVMAAFSIHFSGTPRRKLKYDLIFCAHILLIFFVWGGGIALEWLFFLACQIGMYYLIARVNDPKRVISYFHTLQSLSLAVMAPLAALLLPLYGVSRFHLVNIVSRRPILYFRSFRNAGGSAAFSQIIAKAARRFGIIEGLVHRTQRASDLQGNLDVVEQAHFSTSPDDAWQSWVLGKLRTASVVIVDATDDTESLVWEITRSIESVGTARVAVLAKDGDFPPLPSDVWRLAYTLDPEGIKAARQALSGWLRAQLLDRGSPEAPRWEGDPLPVQERPPGSMSGVL